jgi:photosystem II oxygen-evolving enhancer protein 3
LIIDLSGSNSISFPSAFDKNCWKMTRELLFPFWQLDHAAKIKSTPEAEKYFAATKDVLGDVLAKIG